MFFLIFILRAGPRDLRVVRGDQISLESLLAENYVPFSAAQCEDVKKRFSISPKSRSFRVLACLPRLCSFSLFCFCFCLFNLSEAASFGTIKELFLLLSPEIKEAFL